MSDFEAQLKDLEQRTDEALGTLEQEQRWVEALEVYRRASAELDALDVPRGDPAYRAARRLRAYFYLREANALRALGRHAEAAPLAERELSAAIASGDRLSIARATFSLGTTCLANGEIERGLKFLNDARPMFEHDPGLEHREGLGWWYIIQADISNSGLVEMPADYALESANRALEILRPLESWSGVARAHAARARAYARLGDERNAGIARTAAEMAESMQQLPRHGHGPEHAPPAE